MEKNSFKKGFGQVPIADEKTVKRKIMNALNVKTRAGWRNRLIGMVEPKVSEKKAIEDIFAEYGIVEIWGS